MVKSKNGKMIELYKLKTLNPWNLSILKLLHSCNIEKSYDFLKSVAPNIFESENIQVFKTLEWTENGLNMA